uniref:Uncharacterized protein n=1 Tax=Noctiluca scintillans TaxID=2966 RepID=A0A7S1A0G3_NOCSC
MSGPCLEGQDAGLALLRLFEDIKSTGREARGGSAKSGYRFGDITRGLWSKLDGDKAVATIGEGIRNLMPERPLTPLEEARLRRQEREKVQSDFFAAAQSQRTPEERLVAQAEFDMQTAKLRKEAEEEESRLETEQNLLQVALERCLRLEAEWWRNDASFRPMRVWRLLINGEMHQVVVAHADGKCVILCDEVAVHTASPKDFTGKAKLEKTFKIRSLSGQSYDAVFVITRLSHSAWHYDVAVNGTLLKEHWNADEGYAKNHGCVSIRGR